MPTRARQSRTLSRIGVGEAAIALMILALIVGSAINLWRGLRFISASEASATLTDAPTITRHKSGGRNRGVAYVVEARYRFTLPDGNIVHDRSSGPTVMFVTEARARGFANALPATPAIFWQRTAAGIASSVSRYPTVDSLTWPAAATCGVFVLWRLLLLFSRKRFPRDISPPPATITGFAVSLAPMACWLATVLGLYEVPPLALLVAIATCLPLSMGISGHKRLSAIVTGDRRP